MKERKKGAASSGKDQRPGSVLQDHGSGVGPGGQWSDTTPPPDRGSVKPRSGGVDYLKITIWAPAARVQTLLEQTVISRYLLSVHDEWRDLGPMGRSTACLEGAGGVLRVLEYGSGPFVSLEVRGRGCSLLGHEVLQGLLADLGSLGRWRMSRVDYAWDGCPFVPRQVYEAARAGQVCSRSVVASKPETMQFQESPKVVGVESGETTYLGKRDKASGHYVRVYDKRGPTRLEIELKGNHAHKMGSLLVQSDVSEWGQLFLGALRSMVDFVDLSQETRPSRAPLLPWWADFVGEAAKGLPESLVSGDFEKGGPNPLGRMEMAIQRQAVALQAAVEVFGGDYVLQRIGHYAQRKPDVLASRVEALREWEWLARCQGVAGVPRNIPF